MRLRNLCATAASLLMALALIVVGSTGTEARKGRFVAGLALGLAGAAIVNSYREPYYYGGPHYYGGYYYGGYPALLLRR